MKKSFMITERDFGGLIRDSNEKLVCGFHDNIGYSNILLVEILRLMSGIQISLEKDLKDIVWYIDFGHTIHPV